MDIAIADKFPAEFTAYDLSGQGYTIPLPYVGDGNDLEINIITGSAMLLPGDLQAVLVCDGKTVENYRELMLHIVVKRRIDVLVEDKKFNYHYFEKLFRIETLSWLRKAHMLRLNDIFTGKNGCCLLQCNYMLVNGTLAKSQVVKFYHLIIDAFETDTSTTDDMFFGFFDYTHDYCHMCRDDFTRDNRHKSRCVFSNILELVDTDLSNRCLSFISTRSKSLSAHEFTCILITLFAKEYSEDTHDTSFLTKLIEYANDRHINPESIHFIPHTAADRIRKQILSDPHYSPKIKAFMENTK